MELVITPSGDIRCVYSEMLDLASFGSLTISRASHVEPNTDGHWLADLFPVAGPVLGPFEQRSQALASEQEWLSRHWLIPIE